jgi:hypothetical protein
MAEGNDVVLRCLLSEKCRFSLVGKVPVGRFGSFDVIWYLGRSSCMKIGNVINSCAKIKNIDQVFH